MIQIIQTAQQRIISVSVKAVIIYYLSIFEPMFNMLFSRKYIFM